MKNKNKVSKDQVQRPGPSKAPVAVKATTPQQQSNPVNGIAEALQANRGDIAEETHTISPSDFEGKEQAKKPENEDTVLASPGEAERQRILKQIRERLGAVMPIVAKEAGISYSEAVKERTDKGVAEQQNLIKMQQQLSEQNKPKEPQLTIEQYKILKEHEHIHTAFVKHEVLFGITEVGLNKLGKVMHEAFEPTYKLDFWCPYCIGEFLKDLYRYFDKWKEKQKEVVSEYETIVKKDEL